MLGLPLALSLAVGCAERDGTAYLEPGRDIQAVVANAPAGTRFYFKPGIYRQQTIYPRDRQEFIGQEGVILSGAMVLTKWDQEGALWTTSGLPATLPSHGECNRELCDLREDLFVDGRLYERVGSRDKLGPDRWYYEDGRAYLADSPVGQTVELSVTPTAFGGDAQAVVLRDLTVEKYASEAQFGAIDLRNARGWVLSDLTVQWNHGIGLFIGPETQVDGGTFSHNGQMGMGGSGNGSTIDGVEIAFNNYAGYKAGWEAGGTKFTRTDGLIVRNSCVHHNNGPGLWTDIDNINIVFEDNKVFSNANDGIKHEISYDAIIRDNIAVDNGWEHDVWLWGSQILIQNSQNATVYGNFAEVSDEYGNGISVVHQDRADGAYGPWDSVNNEIHHNTVVYRGSRGMSGVVSDTGEDWFWAKGNNNFDWNTHVAVGQAARNWAFNDADRTWSDVQDLGHEPNGQLLLERRAPTKVTCGAG
ncbi:MAG TPA: right-handed parallel beta-helix repeat-containing protein [Hyphomicrobiaceae bacterium]|jgi:parallel beta-helix repeat protein|nr:right-handed parallel beta-helix repeat-containing protein [Hyphomicrobiaceae bacterium]